MKSRATALLAGLLLSACAEQLGPTMPPFALVDQSGRSVRSESLRGHALVVSFVFTTCVEACPLITAQLARVQARARTEDLDGRVRFVSITLDPATDTPEVLRRYANAYGIDLTTWHFLTGTPDDVARLIRAVGLTSIAREPIAHGSLVLLVDGEGRIAEKRTDLELDPDRLLASLRKLAG
jgi:protein SCO1